MNSTPYIFLVGFRYEQPTGSSLFQSAAQDLMVDKASAEETCRLCRMASPPITSPSRSNFLPRSGRSRPCGFSVHLFNYYTRRQEVPP